MNDELVREICLETARAIFDIPYLSAGVSREATPGLIFPFKKQKNSNPDRISEQEARVKFIEALKPRGIWYSIETPTEEKYRFKDTNPDGYKISARSDLSIYTLGATGLVKTINVEFKAGSPKEKPLAKDIKKFYGEKITSVFFHLLESHNARTLKSFSEKLKKALLSNPPSKTHPHKAFFFLCSLKGRTSWGHWIDLEKTDFTEDFPVTTWENTHL